MSPKWSSAPRISVRTTCLTILPESSFSVTRPHEIPAQGFETGTPASINAIEPPQILAIEVEPFELITSDTRRIE